ncbi:MAG: glycosyltransferase family 2 protein [Candidatus Vogelbacteria bacterium]|nr:glycosyltransferase family 2 protein [Candidatus Vogelbacteria bacterium]
MKLSIIIPCYNEQETLPELLNKVVSLSLENWLTEIIIVNDGSTDETSQILQNFKERYPFLIIYNLPKNQGKGSAIKSGLTLATGDFVIIQDADLEYDPKDIVNLITKVKDKKTIVFGSRNLSTETTRGKLIPRLGVKTITYLINLLYNQNLTDVWTCYKLFPRSAFIFFDEGKFESEITFIQKALRHEYQILEGSISYNPRSVAEGKKIRYRDGLITIFKILKLFFQQKYLEKNIVERPTLTDHK